ncbi:MULTISPECIES: OsmC family peroxiredoxin [Ensifer]|uniref:OsmC family peroxiredoxin n=1 Tax=Ensifer TaxID=106591 RepID=UPI000DC36AAF|nr:MULTISPECIES: OsmC family peroxiredoxin [Ensifer]MCY1745270.1 OsmC family peroxiredoxin [Ensifer sp. SL37]RAR98625.1 hypothetical protein DEU52_1646 [Ensifer adhaerens]
MSGSDRSRPGYASNWAELLLPAIAAWMIKGIERFMPILASTLDGVDVILHAARQDEPPHIFSVAYKLEVDTDQTDQRLELLHNNVRKCSTISNNLALAARRDGVIRRKS